VAVTLSWPLTETPLASEVTQDLVLVERNIVYKLKDSEDEYVE
jgi:hypothetical protein